MAVTLGGFAFQDMEIPETINFSGPHLMARHQLIGGDRVFDAMGDDPAPIEWSGTFLGGGASDRARALDAMKQSGGSFLLTWGSFAREVVIKSFDPRYGFEFRVAYRICVEVVPSGSASDLSIDSLISDDFGSLADFALDGPLGDAIDAAQGAVAAAASTSISGRLSGAPIYALQSAVGVVQSAANLALDYRVAADASLPESDLSAIPGASIAEASAALLNLSDAAASLSDAATAAGYVGRIAGNLAVYGS
jgi:hypothetical protein